MTKPKTFRLERLVEREARREMSITAKDLAVKAVVADVLGMYKQTDAERVEDRLKKLFNDHLLQSNVAKAPPPSTVGQNVDLGFRFRL